MDSEPFAVLPFPEAFRIGNVFSMVVYDLDYEDIEDTRLARPLFKQKFGSRHKLYHLSRRIYSGRHGVITLGFMYAETVKDHGAKRDCFIYCGVNTFWEERSLELPVLPKKMKWYKTAYTYGDNRKEEKINGSGITLAPGSLMVIIGK